MRLVLKEYLLLLKEDKELDSVITNLAIDMDLIPLSNITKGRQHGVDIAAIGIDEDGENKLFLFTIKRGNINRTNWKIKDTDVKPSIESIKDVYIENYLPNEYKLLKKRIILCFNGDFDMNLQLDYSSFKNKIDTDDIKLERWNIDDIVQKIEKYQTLETLFDRNVMLNFRRALALIDLKENKNQHYYLFLESLLEEEKELKEKEIEKRIRLVNLCLAITIKWCSNAMNLKPAYFITERTLLHTYHWLSKKTKHYKNGSAIISVAFAGLIQSWVEITTLYYSKLKSHFSIKHNLFNRSLSFEEYYLGTNEQIGILSCMGNCCLELSKIFYEKNIETASLFYQIAINISESLIDLLENNPSSNYLLFDDDYIDIISAHRLLLETTHESYGNQWLTKMVRVVIHWFYEEEIKPIFYYNLDKLLERKDEHNSSCSLLILAELCVLYKNKSLYVELLEFINKEFKETCFQMIFPEQGIDEIIFKSYTDEASSVLTDVKIPDNIEVFERSIIEENKNIRLETPTDAMKDGLTFLYFISFRHYRNYPFPQFWRDLLSESYSSKFNFVSE